MCRWRCCNYIKEKKIKGSKRTWNQECHLAEDSGMNNVGKFQTTHHFRHYERSRSEREQKNKAIRIRFENRKSSLFASILSKTLIFAVPSKNAWRAVKMTKACRQLSEVLLKYTTNKNGFSEQPK